jgi:hypothetical protein
MNYLLHGLLYVCVSAVLLLSLLYLFPLDKGITGSSNLA